MSPNVRRIPLELSRFDEHEWHRTFIDQSIPWAIPYADSGSRYREAIPDVAGGST